MIKLTYFLLFICRISADFNTQSSSRVPIWLKRKLCKKIQMNKVPAEIPVVPVMAEITNQKIYATSKYEFSPHNVRAAFAHRNTVLPPLLFF